jgi:DNA invertase Pin-like site-specific DNA recombinase
LIALPLRGLPADIEADKIEIVVVCKIDRLTCSLAHFERTVGACRLKCRFISNRRA